MDRSFSFGNARNSFRNEQNYYRNDWAEREFEPHVNPEKDRHRQRRERKQKNRRDDYDY